MRKAKEFDMFFVSEYDYLLSFAKSIDPKSDYESLLHDVYLRCKDRILVAGFDGDSYINFIRVSLMNQYKSNYRLEQKRPKVDFNDVNYYHNIEEHLQLKRDQERQEQDYQDSVSFINTMLFSYIDENFDERDRFIFKTYFLLKNKKMNYKTLAEATGGSLTAVSNTIKKMKADIKMNLELYINGRTITSGYTVST